jgi:hypothetical protein
MLRVCTFSILILAACATDDPPPGPIDDCQLEPDGTLVCPRTFPGCTFMADTAVQFERCGQRREYIVYGRADGCPELYVYPEGAFRDPVAWEDHVGACDQRQ